MKLLICLLIFAAVSFINCHPALDVYTGVKETENDAAIQDINPVMNSDTELIRKTRSFIGGGICCRGGGGFRRRPYFGGGGRPYGGGGFSGSSSYSQSSSHSSSGSFGFGK